MEIKKVLAMTFYKIVHMFLIICPLCLGAILFSIEGDNNFVIAFIQFSAIVLLFVITVKFIDCMVDLYEYGRKIANGEKNEDETCEAIHAELIEMLNKLDEK